MVMEYLEGRDLGAKMASGEAFEIPEAVGYLLEAIDAIAQAHKAGIVHRDLKPANLFLAKRPDGSFRIKVLDFGISKSVKDSIGDMRLTSTATLIGSPLYMSPEQMRSARDVDERADIWSLGAIIFEMLTRRPPYQASTLPALCEALLTSDPPKLREFRPETPEGLEKAVARCLERELERRWPNVLDLAVAIAPFAPTHRSARPLLSQALTETKNEVRPTNPRVQSSGDAEPGTLDPWEDTQDKPAPKKTTLFLGLGLVALVCLGLLFMFRGSNTPAPTSSSPASPSTPAAEPYSETKSAPEVEVIPAPDAALPSPVDPEQPAASAKPAEPVVPVTAKPTALAPQPATAPARFVPKPEPTSKAAQNPSVPDFGGRR
jgi:serine/threonine-protein kinase